MTQGTAQWAEPVYTTATVDEDGFRLDVRRKDGQVQFLGAWWLAECNARGLRTFTTVMRRLFAERVLFVRFTWYTRHSVMVEACADRAIEYGMMDTHARCGDEAYLYRVDLKTGRWTLIHSTEDVYTLSCNEPDPVLA